MAYIIIWLIGKIVLRTLIDTSVLVDKEEIIRTIVRVISLVEGIAYLGELGG